MSKTVELNIPKSAEERMGQINRPCPLCFSEKLHEFSNWTSCDEGMREVKKIMCTKCQCEAPIKYWNVRVTSPVTSQHSGGAA